MPDQIINSIRFDDLGVSNDIKKNVADTDFVEATQVQAESTPALPEGRDAIGRAGTRAGKPATDEMQRRAASPGFAMTGDLFETQPDGADGKGMSYNDDGTDLPSADAAMSDADDTYDDDAIPGDGTDEAPESGTGAGGAPAEEKRKRRRGSRGGRGRNKKKREREALERARAEADGNGPAEAGTGGKVADEPLAEAGRTGDARTASKEPEENGSGNIAEEKRPQRHEHSQPRENRHEPRHAERRIDIGGTTAGDGEADRGGEPGHDMNGEGERKAAGNANETERPRDEKPEDGKSGDAANDARDAGDDGKQYINNGSRHSARVEWKIAFPMPEPVTDRRIHSDSYGDYRRYGSGSGNRNFSGERNESGERDGANGNRERNQGRDGANRGHGQDRNSDRNRGGERGFDRNRGRDGGENRERDGRDNNRRDGGGGGTGERGQGHGGRERGGTGERGRNQGRERDGRIKGNEGRERGQSQNRERRPSSGGDRPHGGGGPRNRDGNRPKNPEGGK